MHKVKILALLTIVLAIVFYCQKNELEDIGILSFSHCDCYNPIDHAAQWEYEVARIHYDPYGNIDESTGNVKIVKEEDWNLYKINTAQTVSPLKDGVQYYARNQGTDRESVYNTKYFRQEGKDYFDLYNLYLKDADVGTTWEINVYNSSRKIINRYSGHTRGTQTYKDVIEVHEIKQYNNGDVYVTQKEFYAKNIGLIYREVYDFNNAHLVLLKKETLKSFQSYD